MALHSNQGVRDRLAEAVYASSDLRAGAPKYRFPKDSMEAEHAEAIVRDEIMLDGNARMNLATFCTTLLRPEARTLMAECADKNIVDKDEYPQTAEIESRCVHMLADLWHAPDTTNAVGTSTVGSSEAAMLGGRAAKWRWGERRRAEGAATTQPNFVCGPVQVCWEKFGLYFDVEKREVPMAHDRVLMTPEETVARCDENTVVAVVTFGQTFSGLYEDVAGISEALDDLQERTGIDVPIHVDGASGGFLAPFVEPDVVWDFRLPRVKSINASGHKMGLAPIGCGWAMWRDKSDLPGELVFDVNYLGGNSPTFCLNFSRPGAPVVVQYFDFVHLGREGYRRIHEANYETARSVAESVASHGPFEVLYDGDPKRGITAVTWRIAPGADPGYSLFDVAESLRARGWLVPAYTLPPHCEDVAVQRALIRYGFSRDMANLLMADFKKTVAKLEKHKPTVPLDEGEAGGFSHSGRTFD